jgi:hypothetical protein
MEVTEYPWQSARHYEGYTIKVRPAHHVVFHFEAKGTHPDRLECKGMGDTFDAAVDHCIMKINHEISKLGS